MKGIVLLVLLLPRIVLSQIEGEPYSSVVKITDKQLKGNKGTLVLSNTGYFIYKNDTVPVMRIPYYLIKSQAKDEILGIQNDLSIVNKDFASRKKLNIERPSSLLLKVKLKDKGWFTNYYEREIEFYQRFEKILRAREIFIADSLIEGKRKADKEKSTSDSLIRIERTKGYHFVNVPRLSLQDQANVSAKVVGTIEAYSYVKKVQEKEVNGYAKISVDGNEGFVLAIFIVNSLDKVTITLPNREVAFKEYFTAFTKGSPNPTNPVKQSTSLKSTPSSKTSNVPLRTYHRGLRGGCFYYNSAGKKVYVDHSYCN